MKKLLLITTGMLMLFTVSVKAQITLDTIITPTISMGDDFYLAQISATETKYVLLNTLNNTFGLYNMDFTPFMTNISVPQPFGQGTNSFMQALYITRSLFDCDSTNIEYAYYSPKDIAKGFRVIRTDGTVLFSLDTANGPYCIGDCLGMTDVVVPIRNTSDGAKLYLQKPHPTQQIRQIYIYSLCGELPTDVFDFTQYNQASVKIFPNPSSGQLTFQIRLLDNLQDYELAVIDNNGAVVKREKVNSQKVDYAIDVSNFSNGSYFYSLSARSKSYKSGKFVLSK